MPTTDEAGGVAPAALLDAIVIGAGFSGLYQLHALRDRLGLSVLALEAAEGVGGTWYWNRYPGARCDSESYSYCFTFSDALVAEWEWSERYPGQAEVLRYLNFVADRLDLRRSICFGARVVSAEYDERANLWRVQGADGGQLSARFLITAVGCLSAANVPDIPGLDTFGGTWHHTGAWPHAGVVFAGKRVGLIGTGSTGIQAAPVIAETAAHLTVFQRTANYSVPARNGPLTPESRRHIRENWAAIRRTMRETTNGHPFRIADRSALEVGPEERDTLYEAAWARGGLQFRATFRDVLTDPAANETAASFIKRKIRAVVRSEATADILADIDHPYAAKRPPIDTDYFETFNRDNVSLVDLRATPVERITSAGIRTSAGDHPLDIIVFATGFDAMTGPLLRLGLRGRGGISLREAWVEGPRSYLGLGIPGFPNLFTITGPGSPSVLCNMPVPIEQHVEWIADCIANLRASGAERIEAKPEAAEQWMEEVGRAAKATLLPQASSSWYLGANVPGKPRAFMPYAGGMTRYRGVCDEVAGRGYEGFALAR
ncbi:flavin-containing monooxygenase [Roseomonas sp. CCTCC AB2023176]|uniref:flavin-containing monooxygenase n=1 Tax=Roseomonas sp. CCTCC AB2023176 TaxID=3342640 RepID=UPI0035D9ACBF